MSAIRPEGLWTGVRSMAAAVWSRVTYAAVVAVTLAACGGGEGPLTTKSTERPGGAGQPSINIVLGVDSEGLSSRGTVRRVPGDRSLADSFEVDAGGSVRFQSAMPADGYYEVLVRWPRPRNALPHTANIAMDHADGRNVLTIDQAANASEWRSLGTYRFIAARPAVVELSASPGSRFNIEALRFTYVGAAPPAPRFATDKLPIGLAQRDYSASVTMSGGAPPFTFAVVDGRLPAGIDLDRGTGRLSGRPALPGRYRFALAATDVQGRMSRQGFELLVDTTLGAASAPDASATEFRLSRKGALSAPPSNPTSGTALSSLQTIVAAMPEGSWQRVNLNSYSSVWTPVPLRTLFNGGEAPPSKIILAWSSFAWDSQRGNLFLYGGGHANYRGNDTYLWRGSTQMWERGSLPSEMVQTPLGVWNAIDGADKAPASAHTYDNTIYLPLLDRFLVLGGAADSNGEHFLTQSAPDRTRITGPYLFDPSRADGDKVGGSTGSHVKRVAPYPEIVGGDMWSNRESWLHASAASTPPVEALYNGCTGYAEENGRDVVYLRTRYRIFRYEIFDINQPEQDRWTLVGRYWYGGSGGQGTCGVDPTRRLLVSTYESLSTPFIFWNLATPGADNRDVLVTPEDPNGEFMPLVASRAIDMSMCAMEYDPVRRNFKLWCGDGRVWTLQPPPAASPTGWTVSLAPPPVGAVPSEGPGAGILGKWDHIPNLDVFMGLADSEQGNIWIYKPVGWVPPWGGGNLPPSVSITSPLAGAAFTVGSDIAVAANATDDGSVVRVEFLANGQAIGESAAAPYSIVWGAPPVGSYSLTARATDDQGSTTTSAAIAIQVDPVVPVNLPPTVSWAAPAEGATFPQGTAVTLEANAADSDGSIAKVEFFLGGSKLGEATTAPFRWVWASPPLGAHALSALATDNLGATATTALRTISVTPPTGGTSTVALQRGAPGSGAVADTYLSTYHRALAFGGSSTLLDERQNYVPLVRFAIFQSEGGPVPDGAPVSSAVLSIYKANAYDMTYAAERMLVDWTEAAATWNERLPGIPWGRAGASLAGSDHAAVADATGSVGWAPGWINLDVTSAVQSWSATGAAGNRGWRLRGVAGYTSALKQMLASEHGGDPTLRPKLTVTYAGAGGNAPPSVSLSAPAHGASFVVGASITLAATASDTDGSVDRVEFFANGVKLGERTAAPWTWTWSGAPIGTHTLTARAIDDAGGATLSSAVTISVTAPPNLPPTVSITSPAEGAAVELGGSFALSASADDADGSIAKVEFFANGVKVGERVASPYELAFAPATAGTFAITARATDDRGAATTSAVVNVVVTSPPVPNVPPTVSWTSPADGAVVLAGTALAVEVNAADADGSVVRVEFFAGSVKIGEAGTAPWRVTWSDPPIGTQLLTAVATDDDGATSATPVRTVQVLPGGTTVSVVLQRGLSASVVHDTYLSTYHRNLGFGSSTTWLDERQNYSPLIRFAIFQSEGGPVPDGAVITSAILSVYKANEYDMTWAAHRMLVGWSEAQATWNQRLAGAPWNAGGANGAGLDYLATPDATASVGWAAGWAQFDLTATVQTMSNGGAANHGWRVRAVSGYVAALKRLHTSEYSADPALRPKLEITYR